MVEEAERALRARDAAGKKARAKVQMLMLMNAAMTLEEATRKQEVEG